jgi:hypothetical protein
MDRNGGERRSLVVTGCGLSTTRHVRSVAAVVKRGTLGLCTSVSGRSRDRRVRSSPREVAKHARSIRRGGTSCHNRPTCQVTSGCLLETTGHWHCGVRCIKRARQVVISRTRVVRDMCVRSWLANALGHLVTVGTW